MSEICMNMYNKIEVLLMFLFSHFTDHGEGYLTTTDVIHLRLTAIDQHITHMFNEYVENTRKIKANKKDNKSQRYLVEGGGDLEDTLNKMKAKRESNTKTHESFQDTVNKMRRKRESNNKPRDNMEDTMEKMKRKWRSKEQGTKQRDRFQRKHDTSKNDEEIHESKY